MLRQSFIAAITAADATLADDIDDVCHYATFFMKATLILR